MAEIKTSEILSDWLSKQGEHQALYGTAIAVRTAIRVLPFVFIGRENVRLAKSLAIGAIRSCVVAWASTNLTARDFRNANGDAFEDYEFRTAAVDVNRNAVFTAAYVLSRANLAASEFDSPADLHAFDAVSRATDQDYAVFADSEAHSAFRIALETDCSWLSDDGGDTDATRRLSALRLWQNSEPVGWKTQWNGAKNRLLGLDEGGSYQVWIDWYERRVRGEDAAFDIPGDKGRVEDKEILRRLAEATDEDFWGKGHEYVNATLKGWLDEARARVAPPLSDTQRPEPGIPTLPVQNPNAISFRAGEDGKIAIDAAALADQLRADAGAQDRHAEAVAEAKMVLDRCQRSNAGARLTRLFENYLTAAGDAVEQVKPSLLVQRGERLRQELAAYTNPDSFLDPVADDLLLDMKGWQSAHNMMVGLDPVLNGMDIAMLGPDRQPTLISPDEIREKIREADEADLLQDGVVEVVEEAANLAPAVPDPNDRHTIWSTEMVRNLMIEIAAVALNHPVASGTTVLAGAAVYATLGAGGLGAVSIMGSIKAAEYLVTHKAWVLSRLGNTPTWQALIARLADWLEKVTPFEPK